MKPSLLFAALLLLASPCASTAVTINVPARGVVKGLTMDGAAPAAAGLSMGSAGATFATNLREILKSATPQTMGPSSLQPI